MRPLGKHGATVRSTRSAPPGAIARRPAHAADHAWRLPSPDPPCPDPRLRRRPAAPLSEPRRLCSRVPHLPQAAQLVKLGRPPVCPRRTAAGAAPQPQLPPGLHRAAAQHSRHDPARCKRAQALAQLPALNAGKCRPHHDALCAASALTRRPGRAARGRSGIVSARRTCLTAARSIRRATRRASEVATGLTSSGCPRARAPGDGDLPYRVFRATHALRPPPACRRVARAAARAGLALKLGLFQDPEPTRTCAPRHACSRAPRAHACAACAGATHSLGGAPRRGHTHTTRHPCGTPSLQPPRAASPRCALVLRR